MDRPAGIERVFGGIMHATFRRKPATGAALLECLDMNNHPLCMHGAIRTGFLLSGHPFNTHGSILARPELK